MGEHYTKTDAFVLESLAQPSLSVLNKVAQLIEASFQARVREVFWRELSFTVRVIGFGDEPMEEAPAEKGAAAPATPAVQVNYAAGSAFQVLGRGQLDPAQRAQLTEAEQRRLTE